MDKKYNIVLGLMIFFFLIIVGVALAWGLGYIGLKDSAENKDNTNIDTPIKEDVAIDNNIEKEDSTNDTESNKNESSLTLSEIEKLNKEYVTMYYSAFCGGSPEVRVQKIMGYNSYSEMESHYTSGVIEDMYKVTDIDYLIFESKLSNLSKELVNKLYSFGSENLFKEYNGKLATYLTGWTGSSVEFVSQEHVSTKDNVYIWNVTFNCSQPDDTIRKDILKATGKLENGKYVLVSVEE